jgi:FkbM family methyltransferase
MELQKIKGESFYIRPNTTDIRVYKEVVENKVYRKKKINFDVKNNESWLDLGANIGSFQYYCLKNGAVCVGFEPDKENYEILCKNAPNFDNFNAAFTSMKEDKLPYFGPSKDSDKYRYTIIENSHPIGFFNNFYAGDLGIEFDGVKMDIEGSEFGLIDNNLIPKCDKLVLEYHFSKDSNFENFYNRIDILKSIFGNVYYIPSIDVWYNKGLKNYPIWIDRFIYCWK